MKKERQSNFELLRIISMFFIVLYHTIWHGEILKYTTGFHNILMDILVLICLVHVNSFIMTSGYFQCEKDITWKKVLKLNNLNWFYRLVIFGIFLIFAIAPMTARDWYHSIIPLDFEYYWFIQVFLLLSIVSPLLNIVIRNIDQKKHQMILLIGFLITTVLPLISNQMAFFNNGYTLYQFIYLYFVGAYFKKYPLKIKNKNKTRIYCALIFIVAVACNFGITYLANRYQGQNMILQELTTSFSSIKYLYNNPFVIVQTVSFFIFFLTLNFKNKWINQISATTFGIYLLHDHPFVRNTIYQFLGLGDKIIGLRFYQLGLRVFAIAIGIFIIAALIEFIRLKLSDILFKQKIKEG